MSIYKPCDIRGDADEELSPSLYERWGQALGQRLKPMTKFVAGGDIRASTPAFLAALVRGLCRAGLDVVDLGQLPTPMIFYAKRRLRAGGCAVVTASHNPASVNGLKWMLGDRPPTPDDIAAMQRSETEIDDDGRTPTAPRSLDVSFDYVACLQETFVESMNIHQHVVIDPMHGCLAGKARRYLHAIFPQCIFATIHDVADPQFGGREPDCSKPRQLHDLCDTVYRERADLGIAFDGDGDRIAFVDDEGVLLTAEEATWLMMNCLADDLRSQRFVHDVMFSDCIGELARRFGAEPLVERSGHAFIRQRMCDSGAIFGAEVSGHYFYRALEGDDDALYTACLAIAYLGRTNRSLAELRRQCPPIHVTPGLRVPADPDRQRQWIEQIRAAWSEFPQRTIDGVRIDLPGGWALVRSSVTEQALTFRFEGLDGHALDDMVERFCDMLPDLGDELWARFRAAMGVEVVRA